MALLPLYRINRGALRSSPSFPRDFSLVAHAMVPDHVLDHLLSLPLNCWSLRKAPRTNYALYKKHHDGKTQSFLLHNIVWELLNGSIPNHPTKLTVDHIDHDGLNCLANNLRLATRQQQCANQKKRRTHKGIAPSSEFKGLTWNSGCSKWHSQLKVNGHLMYLGLYNSEAEAALSYNIVARILYGDFAVPNKIPSGLITDERRQQIEKLVNARLVRKS